MTTEQVFALALACLTAGGVVTKLIDWLRDWVTGHLQKRRAEVDRAFTERESERVKREEAERRNRILEESLAIHRRTIIDAPCLGPDDLPPYPSRKESS